MIPKELAQRIRYIQIYTSRSVNSVLAGEYESVFKGQGIEFQDVREYMPGDEIRSIDWNVTARTGKPFVKRFVEERELTVIFLVDLSASGTFGSIPKTKNEIAAEICALLAYSAIKNNDKVGLIIFTDSVELFIPPKKGMVHVLRIIRELLSFTPRKADTDIAGAVEYAGKVINRHAVAFLISDFIETGFEHPMRVMAKRHDLIAVSITDERENRMPNVGLIELEDAETGEIVLVDTSSSQFRTDYQRQGRERNAALSRIFSSQGVDHIAIQTNQDYVKSLIRFFAQRERRM